LAEFLFHFIPLLRQFFILLIILFAISGGNAFIENIRASGRIPPLEIEYMGTRFKGRRLVIAITAAILLNILLILFNPLMQSYFSGPIFLIFYLVLVVLGAGITVYSLDQFLFLSGVLGVFFSNFFKDREVKERKN